MSVIFAGYMNFDFGRVVCPDLAGKTGRKELYLCWPEAVSLSHGDCKFVACKPQMWSDQQYIAIIERQLQQENQKDFCSVPSENASGHVFKPLCFVGQGWRSKETLKSDIPAPLTPLGLFCACKHFEPRAWQLFAVLLLIEKCWMDAGLQQLASIWHLSTWFQCLSAGLYRIKQS